MKILLVDNHEILLDGIAQLLSKSVNEVVERAKTIEDALEYFDTTEFDILIADYNVIDDNGLVLIRKVKQIYPNLKLIVLNMNDEAHLVEEILKEGTSSHKLSKKAHHDLSEALTAIKKGKIQISDKINTIIQHAVTQQNHSFNLTEKEQTALNLIARNYSKKEIGEEMKLSERSVNTVCRSLFKKTKTSSIVGLLKYAYANNLV